MSAYDLKDPVVIARFDRLCQLEPRLRILYDEASQVKDDGSLSSFCANDVWYGKGSGFGFRRRLKNLVGFGAGIDKVFPTDAPLELCSSESYDIAYDVIYGQLPACRNCRCL